MKYLERGKNEISLIFATSGWLNSISILYGVEDIKARFEDRVKSSYIYSQFSPGRVDGGPIESRIIQ
jgi:hypothetical protein